MNWKQQWLNEVLSEIPTGGYRERVEMELRDHLETQCRSLMDAGRTRDEARTEALRFMGEPEILKGQYGAAWRRSRRGRLETLALRLRTWAVSLAVMFGTRFLIGLITGAIWNMAISLPGNLSDPQIRMIRDFAMDYRNSYVSLWLPLIPALIAGAYYLSRKTRTQRYPARRISGVLSFYWSLTTAFQVWWEALDDHITFWEELKVYLPYNAGYYGLTFALCLLLGLTFGLMAVRENRRAAS